MTKNVERQARKQKRSDQQPDDNSDNEGEPSNLQFCDALPKRTEEFASFDSFTSLETVGSPLGPENYMSKQQHDLATLVNFLEFDAALNLNKNPQIDNFRRSTASTSGFSTVRCDIPAPLDQHFQEVSSETLTVGHEISFHSPVTAIQKTERIDSAALLHPEEEILVVPMSDCVFTGETDHANSILHSFPPLFTATEDDVSLTECIPDHPWLCSDSEEEAEVPDETPTVDFQNLPADRIPVFEETVEDESLPHHHDQPLFPRSEITIKESFLSILLFVQCEHLSGKGLVYAIEVVALKRIYVLCAQMILERFSIFLSFPLVPQLKRICERSDFVHNINYTEKKFVPGATYLTLTWNTDGLQIYKSSSFSLWPWYFVINELPPEKRFLSENLVLGGIWGGKQSPTQTVFFNPFSKM
ncbi:Serine--tRNA ligase 1 [Frankliniella fusca]|uniref:Serine--tRNA ligase 1 n=1 Tax=Frankliniella fusca TaxID=407009 RepID=A0AAE1LLN0_9NEOP|nr:Serine--tRNA ligase 1 [Frankliniella fusca]